MSVADTREIFHRARDSLKEAHVLLEAKGGDAPVDVNKEFGVSIVNLAERTEVLCKALLSDKADPVIIVNTIHKLANDTEGLIIRFQKVSKDVSADLRKKAVDIQYEQPLGVVQILRNIHSGVYEGGNGGSCLPAVLELVGRLCDLQEEFADCITAHSCKV